MITSCPTISRQTMQAMYPELENHLEDLINAGYWFYSIPQQTFLSYLPSLNIYVDSYPTEGIYIDPSSVKFLLRRYSSVYELSLESGGFTSSLLLASNLSEIVSEYIDITDNTCILILDNQMSSIMLGNRQALERMVITQPANSFRLFTVNSLLSKGGM